MDITLITKDQSVLMTALLEATRKDYSSSPEARKGDIVAGANSNNFSFRNNGSGIPFERMVRALFPLEGETNTMSDLYPIEPLMSADVLELHSFRNKEHAMLRYEKGIRMFFNVEPDTAQDGILIRVEWQSVVRPLAFEDLPGCANGWKPVMFFNGNRVEWLKLMNK